MWQDLVLRGGERRLVTGDESIHTHAEFILQIGAERGGGGQGIEIRFPPSEIRGLIWKHLTTISVETVRAFELHRERQTSALRQRMVQPEVIQIVVIGAGLLPIESSCIQTITALEIVGQGVIFERFGDLPGGVGRHPVRIFPKQADGL